jgi:hypothetical protein
MKKNPASQTFCCDKQEHKNPSQNQSKDYLNCINVDKCKQYAGYKQRLN